MLALDHGKARCGCAVSDADGTIATPVESVDRPDSPQGLDAISKMAARYQAQSIVVGLPVLLSGEEGTQSAAARSFAGRLRRVVDIPIELYDERFTTKMAGRCVRAGSGAAEDSLAAAHLLESYLQRLRNI